MLETGLLTARQAADRLGIKLDTLYAYVSRGRLRSVGVPGSRERRYRTEDVEALLAMRSGRPLKAASDAEDAWGRPPWWREISWPASRILALRWWRCMATSRCWKAIATTVAASRSLIAQLDASTMDRAAVVQGGRQRASTSEAGRVVVRCTSTPR